MPWKRYLGSETVEGGTRRIVLEPEPELEVDDGSGGWVSQSVVPGIGLDACAEVAEEVSDVVYHGGKSRPVRRVESNVCGSPTACDVDQRFWGPAAEGVPYPSVFLQTNLRGDDCIPVNRLMVGRGLAPWVAHFRLKADMIDYTYVFSGLAVGVVKAELFGASGIPIDPTEPTEPPDPPPPGPPAPTDGTASIDRYIAARQKILVAAGAPASTLTLSETISKLTTFHRPSTAAFPARRGWISDVSSVTLNGAPLTADKDFVFYPDRQCFYFLDPATAGNIEITGSAMRNFVKFGVAILKSVTAPVSSTNTNIDTTSPDFQVTSVSVTSKDRGIEQPEKFYFDSATATLFIETNFSAAEVKVIFRTDSGAEIESALPAFTNASRLPVPKSLNAVSVSKVFLAGAQIAGRNVSRFTPFSVLEKTESGDDILHLGWNYPTGYDNGDFTISATKGTESYIFTFNYWPGNAFELPRELDNVHILKIGAATSLVVFDATDQKIVFCKKQIGQLNYTAAHKAYEGLASGGETIEIVAEIPGVFATTAGTGHHISTLRTFSPSLDWWPWWYKKYQIYFVQIVDDQNVVIYQDGSDGAIPNSRPGYTAKELLPLTLKLPFAPLWSLSRRDDTSLFQAAFAPDFVSSVFSSATFPELDDTQRYAADSMAAGKSVTLSTNKSIPLRGVQGVNFTGPKPTYYAGATIPYLVLSTYKWFVVKCTNRNGNSRLTEGTKYLLCVNNTHFDNRSIMVNITNEGYNVAADLYELKEGN
jgi:hypothetical protein